MRKKELSQFVAMFILVTVVIGIFIMLFKTQHDSRPENMSAEDQIVHYESSSYTKTLEVSHTLLRARVLEHRISIMKESQFCGDAEVGVTGLYNSMFNEIEREVPEGVYLVIFKKNKRKRPNLPIFMELHYREYYKIK